MTATHLRPRLLTALCYGAMAALALGLNLLPIYLLVVSRTYGGAHGLSHEQLGRIGALTFTGLVLGIIVTGPLADRWGAKRFIQFGNGAVALGLIGAAVAPSYPWLCAALFCVGFGAGVYDMVLSPVIAALHPGHRSSAMNWLHSFYCVGAVVTVLVGTLALQAGVSWCGACLMLVPLPLALLAAFAPLQLPALVSERGRTPLAELLRQPWFAFAVLAIFLGGATELGMAQWLPTYAQTVLGFPVWVGGAALLGFSVLMAAGRMVIGFLGRRVSPFTAMVLGCVGSVLLFVAGTTLHQPQLALACCVAVGFTGSCLWPTMLAVAADRQPDGGASMFGILASFGNAGGIVMPWLVGWIADACGLRWGLAISALAPALMLPLVLMLARRPLGSQALAPAG